MHVILVSMLATTAADFLLDKTDWPQLTLDRLASCWRQTILEIRATPPLDLETGPSLPHRLRGAWGHALRRAAVASPEAAGARSVFFDDHGVWRAGAQLPKPFVITADEERDRLCIRLVLFGVAGHWRQPAFDGLVAALEQGIAISGEDGARRRPLPIDSVSWTRLEHISIPPAGLSARLRFLTPLRLGPRHTLGLRYGDIIVSLAERAAGLARWQGFAVEPELGRWRAIANRLTFVDDGLVPELWSRRSGAQQGQVIPMAGLSGHLDILRPPEAIMPLLALGESMHVGGGAALGLGRYQVL